jgi:eukaryotic-like serine/threonine-protein kinase
MWFDRAGKILGSLPPPPDEEYLNPAISPTGELVAVNRMDPGTGHWDIWLVDVIRGISSKFTTSQGQDTDAIWSPDGKEIVFASDRGGHLGLNRKTVGGSESEELLLKIDGDADSVVPSDWSKDGRFVLYSRHAAPGGWSLWALPLAGDRTPVRVTRGAFNQFAARLSPDGRWVAYESSETGAFAVYVQGSSHPASGNKSRGAGILQTIRGGRRTAESSCIGSWAEAWSRSTSSSRQRGFARARQRR